MIKQLTIMKSIALTLTLLTFTLQAQIVNIPDANFKAKLLAASPSNTIASIQTPVYNSTNNTWSVSSYDKIDTNNDGEIQVSEAQAIKWLNVFICSGCSSSLKISNLSGIESFTNLQYLDCFDNHLTILDLSGLTNLRGLYCKSNELTTLNVSGLTNLQYLDCYGNELTTLDVSGLTNLQRLYCESNELTTLNASGLTNLQYLDCYGNELTTLDVSGLTNLRRLHCNSNKLTTLNVSGLTNLQYLHCTNNLLTSLNVSGATNLYQLYCSYNELTTLDLSGFTNLYYLLCNYNQLSTLNVSGATNLFELDCYYNQLTTLDVSGATNLYYLRCYYNHLPTLDVSGLTGLSDLYCYYNDLTTLNVSGATNLSGLYCAYNELTTLDLSGASDLTHLDCSDNNELTYLNIKNSRNELLIDFSFNPSLQYICADESQLTAVQQRINQWGLTNCHVNSYCSFTPGGTFYTIQGQATFDNEPNGCDVQDVAVPNFKINITNGSVTGSLISNGSGYYNIPVSSGTHTLTPMLENPSYFNISPTSFSVGFPANASPYTQNFCITSNGVHNDVEVSIIPITPARPGFDAVYKIVFKNKGNTIQSGSVMFNFDSNKLDFVTAYPATSTQQTSTLTWDYANLFPFETRSIVVTLNVNSPMENPAVNGGDVLTYIAIINPISNDEMPIDNTISFHQTVVGSYDPNDKTCVEGNSITPTMVGNYLHYVIRFENTGNYPAENIVVKDIIDTAKFDISTLQLTQTSHNCTTRITNPNKVEFIFENINLPFDDATNDGFIAFKIKTNATVALNEVIKNKADIYFDYNFPITTNETQTTIQVSAANEEFSLQNISIFPNPAKDFVTLNILNETPLKVEIFDINGRLLQASTLENNRLDVSQLKTGNYFIKVITQNKKGFVKMAKE